jgi:hypothetical protein
MYSEELLPDLVLEIPGLLTNCIGSAELGPFTNVPGPLRVDAPLYVPSSSTALKLWAVTRGHVETVIAVCLVFVTAQRKVGKSAKMKE